MEIQYRSIGVIRTPFEDTAGMPRNPGDAAGSEGRVELDPEYAAGLKDVEGFSHLILLFHCHGSRGHELQLVPRGTDEARGVFATRAPRRPNAIGLSVVRLDRVVDHVLHVRDVDMIDRTPLLDIKPYLPSIDAHADATMGWLARMDRAGVAVAWHDRRNRADVRCEQSGTATCRRPGGPAMEYNDALARLRREGRVLPHDDPATDEARQRFEQLFDAFTPEALPEAVRTTYAADTFFNDSLRTVRDRETLAGYLAGSAEAVERCTVQVDEWTPAATGWYVRWRMTIRFRHFRRGTDTHSIGVSHIVFDRDRLVALHQDFWDAAGGFYEHLPVLGGLMRRIRRRL